MCALQILILFYLDIVDKRIDQNLNSSEINTPAQTVSDENMKNESGSSDKKCVVSSAESSAALEINSNDQNIFDRSM